MVFCCLGFLVFFFCCVLAAAAAAAADDDADDARCRGEKESKKEKKLTFSSLSLSLSIQPNNNEQQLLHSRMAMLLAVYFARQTHAVKFSCPETNRELAEAAIDGAYAACRLDAKDRRKRTPYRRRRLREQGVSAVLAAVGRCRRQALVGRIVDEAVAASGEDSWHRFLSGGVRPARVPLADVPWWVWDLLAGWIDGDGCLTVDKNGRVQVRIEQAIRGSNALLLFLHFFGG